ncbi:uncharacterized protein LOC132194893 [Neocloeon triangulifer]|uniref:uncharacterized protein LOC132194893 n=1 Tax=Neocloeon triangulifer TaxID=2078957 RepID=UPI00286F80DF|nr:uncharacterized protein LOC132194893 [Neocloeon triangulifer]
MFFQKMQFAFVAGISAALGSVFGKLSGSTRTLMQLVNISKVIFHVNEEYVLFGLRSTFFILMIACNASVWSFYVRALQHSNSSLPATVISTATNYIVSALLGVFLFGEKTGLLWWTGTSLVIFGLAIIAKKEEVIVVKKFE